MSKTRPTRHVRLAQREAEALGGRVVKIDNGGRHTEMTIEGNGHTGILRLHRGTNVSARAETGIRASVRRILEGRLT